jgi:hypothetical protein
LKYAFNEQPTALLGALICFCSVWRLLHSLVLQKQPSLLLLLLLLLLL